MINFSQDEKDKFKRIEFSKLKMIESLTKRVLIQLPDTVQSSKYSNIGTTKVNPFVSENAKLEVAKYLAEQIYQKGGL